MSNYKKIKYSSNRLKYKKTEVFQRVLKMLRIKVVSTVSKLLVQKFLVQKLLISMFRIRIKNFCALTGRSRGVYRRFQISRIQIRLLGATGIYFGLKKAS